MANHLHSCKPISKSNNLALVRSIDQTLSDHTLNPFSSQDVNRTLNGNLSSSLSSSAAQPVAPFQHAMQVNQNHFNLAGQSGENQAPVPYPASQFAIDTTNANTSLNAYLQSIPQPQIEALTEEKIIDSMDAMMTADLENAFRILDQEEKRRQLAVNSTWPTYQTPSFRLPSEEECEPDLNILSLSAFASDPKAIKNFCQYLHYDPIDRKIRSWERNDTLHKQLQFDGQNYSFFLSDDLGAYSESTTVECGHHECHIALQTLFLHYGTVLPFDGLTVDCIFNRPQGKTHKHRAANKTQKRFKTQNCKVFEFGKFYNLSQQDDARQFYNDAAYWIDNVKYPKQVDRLVDFVQKWTQAEHRKLVLNVLTHEDNRTACLFKCALSGKLTQERMDNWNFTQPQFLDVTSGALLFMMLLNAYLMFDKHYGNGVKQVTNAAATFNSITETIQSATQKVLDWIHTLVEKLTQCWKNAAFYIKVIVSSLCTMLAVLLAFEYAKSWFPNWLSPIKSAVCSHLGYIESEPQGKTFDKEKKDTPTDSMDYCMEFINNNFIKAPVEWMSYFRPIERFVTVARSFEWLYQNMGKFTNKILSFWRGEAVPDNQIEYDIMEFHRIVLTLEQVIKVHTAEEIYSKDIQNMFVAMDVASKRLERQVVTSKADECRMVFTTKFSLAQRDWISLQNTYNNMLRTSEKRPMPVVVYIYGPPKTGKTVDMEPLLQGVHEELRALGLVQDEPWHDGLTFTIAEGETFWDSYKKQPYLIYDDIFQSTVKEVLAQTALDLIHFASTAPVSLKVADMHDKGHTHFNSKVIICTSNNPSSKFPEMDICLTSPEALQSRIAINVVKKGYTTYELTEESYAEGLRMPTQYKDGKLVQKYYSKPFETDDLASLIVAAVAYQAQACKQPVRKLNVKKFIGKFISPRTNFDSNPQSSTQPALCLDSEKGKEKVKEEDRTDVVVEGDITTTPDEPLKFRSKYHEMLYTNLSKEEREHFWAREKEWQEQNHAKKVARDIEAYKANQEIVPEAQNNIWSYIYALQDKLGNFWKYLIEKASLLYHDIGRAWDSPSFDFLIYKRLLSTQALQDRIAANPADYLPIPPNPADCGNMRRWYEAVHHLLTPEDEALFRAPVAAYLRKNPGDQINDEEIMNVYARRNNSMSLMKKITIGATTITAIAALAWGIVKCLIPAEAYEPQSADYDAGATARARKAPGQVRVRANMRRAHLNKKQNPQAWNFDLVSAIRRNSDFMEVYLGDPQEPWSEVKQGEPRTSSFVFFPFSNYCLIPGHTFLQFADTKKTIYLRFLMHGDFAYALHEVEMVEEFPGDVVLCKFPKHPQRPDMFRSFADEVEFSNPHAHVLPDPASGDCLATRLANPPKNVVNETFVTKQYGSFETDFTVTGCNNFPGMCGTLYIDDKLGRISAFHMAGNPRHKMCFAVQITKDMLAPYHEDVIAISQPPNFPQCNPFKTPIPSRGVQWIGKVAQKDKNVIQDETALMPSSFDPSDLPFKSTDTFGPAYLKPFTNTQGQFVDPLRNAFDRIASQGRVPQRPDLKYPVDIHQIMSPEADPAEATSTAHVKSTIVPPYSLVALNEYLKDVPVSEKEFVEFYKLTYHAIHGDGGDMKSIDFQTSVGYYFKRLGWNRRRLCFDEDKPFVHPLLLVKVIESIRKLRNDEVVPAVFEENLKDELKSEAKRARTRLFCAGDLTSLVIQRIYLGRLFTQFTKFPTSTPVGIAINPHSAQWGQLYSYLRTYGWNRAQARKILAGDFSNFDFSVPWEAVEIFINFCSKWVSEKELRYVILSNFHGWHIIGDKVFVRTGTASGSYITTMFNTFWNWYVHYHAFINVYSEEDWKTVASTFCGDDSALGVNEEYKHYTMEYLQKFFLEVYGMTYTSPTKTSTMHVEWEDLQFLKRRFVEGHFGIMAPLAEDSLVNMVSWSTDEDRETRQSVVNSLLQESFHYGKEKYEQTFKWVQKEMQAHRENWTFLSFRGMCKLRSKDYPLVKCT